MRRTRLHGAVAFLAILGLTAACATTPAADTEPVMDPQPAAAGISDGGIAGVAQTANTGEIEQAQLAVSKATNASVRQFAERMIAEHTRANEELDEVLRQANLSTGDAPLATELRQEAATALETLRPLEGDAFDRAYIENQISLHERLLRSLDDTLIPAARAGAVRTYLQNMRGTVAEHLEEARQIRTALGG